MAPLGSTRSSPSSNREVSGERHQDPHLSDRLLRRLPAAAGPARRPPGARARRRERPRRPGDRRSRRRAPRLHPVRDARVDVPVLRDRSGARAHPSTARHGRLGRGGNDARAGARRRRQRRAAPAAADAQRRLRDPQGGARAPADAGGGRPHRQGDDRLLAEGRNGQDDHCDEPRRSAREARGQAHAAPRPRPAVRRRRDRARPRAREDDLRPRHRPGRARLREARGVRHQASVRHRRPRRTAPARGRRARHGGQGDEPARGRARLLRGDRRRHLALLPRADAGDARPHRRAARPLRARRADAQERPPRDADARAPLVPDEPHALHHEPGEHQRRLEDARGRGGAEGEDRARAAVGRHDSADGEPRQPGRPRRAALRVLAGDRTDCEADRAADTRGRSVGGQAAAAEAPVTGARLRRREMGLHDRLARNTEASNGAAEAGSEVVVDPYAELKARVHNACIAKLGPELFKQDETELGDHVFKAVSEELTLAGTPLTKEERRELVRQLTDDILGYGPLEQLLADDSVTEVMVNAADRVYVERSGKIERTPVRFVDDAHVMRIIDKIVSQIGRRVDESSPMVDARLPDGSRVNAIIPPLSLTGPTLTIRKFARDPYTINDLISFGTLSARGAQFLGACVRGKLNMLISGGTGTGKTTTLNAVSAFIPGDERIVTIEDAAELQLQQEHVITLESRPANIEGTGEIKIRELVRNALRMRPDRIIVGEVRGPETLDMLQAMNTGHEGSLTTIHANAPRDALARLETLVMTAGVELPHRAIREQISSAFDVLVQISRLVDGSRRLTHITEVSRMESDVITLQDVFIAKPPDEESAAAAAAEGNKSARLLGSLECTGLKPGFLEKMAANGVILPPSFFGGQNGYGSNYSAASFGGFE